MGLPSIGGVGGDGKEVFFKLNLNIMSLKYYINIFEEVLLFDAQKYYLIKLLESFKV